MLDLNRFSVLRSKKSDDDFDAVLLEYKSCSSFKGGAATRVSLLKRLYIKLNRKYTVFTVFKSKNNEKVKVEFNEC